MALEFGRDGLMKWQRVIPPIDWPKAQVTIIADRHLPDGTRQHMVADSVPLTRVIANAQLIGQDEVPDAEFSAEPSHLSALPLDGS